MGIPCRADFKHRARDAGELADLRSFRTALHRKASSRLVAARQSGLRVQSDGLRRLRKLVCAEDPASRAPLLSSWAPLLKPRTQERAARTGAVGQKTRATETMERSCAGRATRSNTLPWRGRVDANGSERRGWGDSSRKGSPHPGSHSLCSCSPTLPPGEGGAACAARAARESVSLADRSKFQRVPRNARDAIKYCKFPRTILVCTRS